MILAWIKPATTFHPSLLLVSTHQLPCCQHCLTCCGVQRTEQSDVLSAGSCAITFGMTVFRASNAGWANVTGNIGTGIFPGTTQVLDRTSNALQPCTKALYPLAVASAQTKQLVNFAPLYVVYRTQMLLAPTITGEAIAGTGSLLTFMSSRVPAAFITPLLTALGMLSPATNVAASNASAPPASSPASPFNPQPLVAIGYNVGDTIAYLSAAFSGIVHSNQLQDIALPGAAYFRCVAGNSVQPSRVPVAAGWRRVSVHLVQCRLHCTRRVPGA
jgi:hypothetical protein